MRRSTFINLFRPDTRSQFNLKQRMLSHLDCLFHISSLLTGFEISYTIRLLHLFETEVFLTKCTDALLCFYSRMFQFSYLLLSSRSI